MALSTQVIAVGSEHGDDQVAWRAAELLRESVSSAIEIAIARTPLDILDYLEGCQRLIVMDACCSAAPVGQITRLQWPDERIRTLHRHSTHNLGLADSLWLAETLGRLPAVVVVFAVEIHAAASREASPLAETLTPAVAASVPELVRRVARDCFACNG